MLPRLLSPRFSPSFSVSLRPCQYCHCCAHYLLSRCITRTHMLCRVKKTHKHTHTHTNTPALPSLDSNGPVVHTPHLRLSASDPLRRELVPGFFETSSRQSVHPMRCSTQSGGLHKQEADLGARLRMPFRRVRASACARVHVCVYSMTCSVRGAVLTGAWSTED